MISKCHSNVSVKITIAKNCTFSKCYSNWCISSSSKCCSNCSWNILCAQNVTRNAALKSNYSEYPVTSKCYSKCGVKIELFGVSGDLKMLPEHDCASMRQFVPKRLLLSCNIFMIYVA